MRQPLVTASVIVGVFLAMLLLERLCPLRHMVEPKLRHVARNGVVAGVSLAFMTLLQAPLLAPLSRTVAEHHVGVLNAIALPRGVAVVVAILLLDYTLWFWHWANHRVPFLWRFHLAHHVDRDLDSSTALRFHFGELALSIGYRALQIAVIGADPWAVWLWQTLLFGAILFHHANVRLPVGFERVLVRFVVTPRMHGIHHSDRRDETDSNWSSLLSCWDYLHRTLVLDVPQREITIGVAAWSRPEGITLGRVLALPFGKQRDDWKRSDGKPAIERRGGSAPTRLVP